MDAKKDELSKIFTPVREIINFDLPNNDLGTKKEFREEIEKLSGGENLPTVFPDILNTIEARSSGIMSKTPDILERELTLPDELLNSKTYEKNLKLKMPMEEIILAYASERVKQGLSRIIIEGFIWDKFFLNELKRIQKFKKSRNEWQIENEVEEELQNTQKNINPNSLKGTKLA